MNLTQAYLPADSQVRVDVGVDELRIDLDRALSCGMIVNELVTNAIKYAFPGSPRGTIRVACGPAPDDADQLVLEVTDDGVGFDTVVTGGTLGLELVRTLAAQLGGRLVIDAGAGATLRVRFPRTAGEPAEVA